MLTLIPVQTASDILLKYRGTPIERLLRYQNLGHPFPPSYEIGDPIQFVAAEALRLRSIYPGLMIAPLFYTVEDDHLLQIEETAN